MKTYKKLILILALLTINSDLFAQQVFPQFTDDAHWNVLECFWMDCYTKTYSYEYDTTFCGQNYSKINFTEQDRSGYFRSDTLKTYFRKSTNCSDKEYLIYDYSLNIGDTVFVADNHPWNLGNDTMDFVLVNIDTVNYFGINRQRFLMLYDPSNQGVLFRPMYWIKGIGSETHPFYSFFCLHDGCEQGYQLLCYDSLSTQLYQNPWLNVCDTTILGTYELENDLSIYPNPFSTEIYISLDYPDIISINVYSSVGKKIIEISTNGELINKIETSFLKSGSYILEIRTNQGKIKRTIVKIE
jgi:hypothetical protein